MLEEVVVREEKPPVVSPQKKSSELIFKEIFETYYPVSISAMYVYTDWQLEVAGIPSMGDDVWDIQTAHQKTFKQATIGEMADWLEQDIPFNLTEIWVVPHIYNCIKDYVKLVSEGFNRNRIVENRVRKSEDLKTVTRDLEKLVALANHFYGLVEFVRGVPQIDEFKEGLIHKLRKTSFKRSDYQEETVKEEKTEEVKVVMNLKDFLSDRMESATRPIRRGGPR